MFASPSLLLSALSLLLWIATACSSSSSPLSSAKQTELKKALAAFEGLSPDMQGALAAAAVAEVESERLPAPLLSALESISQAPPDMRAMLVARGLAESLPSVQTMCQGAGLEMMRTMAEQAPEGKLSLIRTQCKTERFGLVSNPGPGTDALLYLLAHVVLSHLQENGGASANEKALIKYLATAQAPTNPY